MELKMLDAYGVKNGIKRGMTIEDFCTKYGCSPKELQTHLEKNLYTSNRREVKKRLVEMNLNAKKAKPKKPESVAKSSASAMKEELVSETLQAFTTISCAGVASVDANEVINEAFFNHLEPLSFEDLVRQRTNDLAQAQKTEDERRGQVLDTETEIKGLRTQKKGGVESVREKRDELEALKDAFKRGCAELEQLIETVGDIDHRLADAKLRGQEAEKTLESARSNTKELETLNLLVYDNCELQYNDEKIQMPFNEVAEAFYYELREKPECEELKIKEIKLLAKLLVSTRDLAFNVELICDNEELEKAYLKLK